MIPDRRPIMQDLNHAEERAWDSLSRYKFDTFAYWVTIWIKLIKIGEFNFPNPWRDLVQQAKARIQFIQDLKDVNR